MDFSIDEYPDRLRVEPSSGVGGQRVGQNTSGLDCLVQVIRHTSSLPHALSTRQNLTVPHARSDFDPCYLGPDLRASCIEAKREQGKDSLLVFDKFLRPSWSLQDAVDADGLEEVHYGLGVVVRRSPTDRDYIRTYYRDGRPVAMASFHPSFMNNTWRITDPGHDYMLFYSRAPSRPLLMDVEVVQGHIGHSKEVLPGSQQVLEATYVSAEKLAEFMQRTKPPHIEPPQDAHESRRPQEQTESEGAQGQGAWDKEE